MMGGVQDCGQDCGQAAAEEGAPPASSTRRMSSRAPNRTPLPLLPAAVGIHKALAVGTHTHGSGRSGKERKQ